MHVTRNMQIYLRKTVTTAQTKKVGHICWLSRFCYHVACLRAKRVFSTFILDGDLGRLWKEGLQEQLGCKGLGGGLHEPGHVL